MLPLLFLSLAALAFASSPADTGRIRNANHIFNAIHSSMRQWGGSWYHNGMSFFLATVPAGTQFYHGTDKSEPVNGTEWLAFEPEHALAFARPRPRGHPPGKDRQDRPASKRKLPQKREQKPLRGGNVEGDDEAGFLHTYVTAKDLRLLYLDGLSAGKTDMGTLDSQDRILLRDNITGPGFQEYERAALACQIARDDWHGRIDGILRMEAGFEIILCDFARDLHVVRISRVKGGRRGGPRQGVEGFSTYKAIAARFNGIGGGRVRVNYDHFVTAYTYEDLDLFQGGKNELPRLAHFSYDELEPLRKDLSRLVLEHDAAEPSFDWQSIADMIIERYSNELKYLASGNLSSIEALHAEIETLLAPFIDYALRNATAEAERCATQFIPASAPSETLAARVVYDVAYTICSTLRSVLDEEDHGTAVASVQQLIDYLGWTTWKECPQKCRYNEVCFIPIWPSGTVEDREHPQCRDRPSSEGERYWRGGPGRGPPRDGFDKHGHYDEL
ncbi:hypothetical protein VTN96DRAFT_5341 [Rasamsonia emersonii]|uniref:Uncharacterized protein n=1 Tax=Rasamsonia emersonii (strain ATCC 16479 / CBS 393.64 / IMI 116815) TaxID=1408163 RepID=A0A0F4YY64_RASE3|nr:hypothetical protein T310_2796 [Rasamsonia emersonii CBS 393.64]KKA23164.1 hypothetical protein T310_2796 [Rasamsonia emersonii CBS 393.64]